MLIRTYHGVVFERDWNRERIGLGFKYPAAEITGCDLFTQAVFCPPRGPTLTEPKPVTENPCMEQLELLLNP
jgi:hypothetical protein